MSNCLASAIITHSFFVATAKNQRQSGSADFSGGRKGDVGV